MWHEDIKPGPSQPRSIRRTRSEPVNHDFALLMAGDYAMLRPWSTVALDTDSLMTDKHFDFSTESLPLDKGKNKDTIDRIPERDGFCDHCEGQHMEAGSGNSNPDSSALIARILAKKEHEVETVENPCGMLLAVNFNDPRMRQPPSPCASPRRRSSEATSQSDAMEQLKDARTQLESQIEALHQQHRQSGVLIRLQAPYRRVGRYLKKLLRAVNKLLEALKETIASCFIIERILKLVWSVDDVVDTRKEEEKAQKAQAARGGMKQLCNELRERKSGSRRKWSILNSDTRLEI